MIELLEDVRQIGRRDPAASVAQQKEEQVRLLRAGETDLAVSRSITQSILEEIIQHLLQTMQIQQNRSSTVSQSMAIRKCNVVRRGLEPVKSCFALKRFCQLYRLRLDHKACLLQRRNEQYII